MENLYQKIILTDEEEIAILRERSEADQEARMLTPAEYPLYKITDRLKAADEKVQQLQERYRKAMNLTMLPHLVFDPLIRYDQEETSVTEADAAETVPVTFPHEEGSIKPIQLEVRAEPLVPAAMPVSYPNSSRSFTDCVLHQFGNTSPARYMEPPKRIPNAALEDALLNKVRLKRIQDTVYLFNGAYYHKMTANELESLIHQHLRESLGNKAEAHQINEIKKLITTDNRIVCSKPDHPHGLINLSNGVYDIFQDTLTPHNPNWFFTYALTVPWVPGSECPAFDCYLRTVTKNDAALTQRFWEALGYALVPDNRGKRFLYLYGDSQTGKTVLCKVLESFFPEDVVSSVSVFDMDSTFGYSGLVDKQINICSELSGGCLGKDAVGKIKAITGGDTVEVNEKYKALYKTKLNVRLVFASNHAIRLSSNDDAFVQRCLTLLFRNFVPVEARDRFLVQKLLNELPGILQKAIDAYRQLVRRNYVFTLDNHIHPPVIIKHCTEEKNMLEYFIRNYCKLDPQSRVTTSDLFTHYNQYAAHAGWALFENERDFGVRLSLVLGEIFPNLKKKRGRFPGFDNPVNGYIGLALLP